MASYIEITTSFISTKVTDRSVAATCTLGSSFQGTGLSAGASGLVGISAVVPASLASLPVRDERNERPIQAPGAAVAKGRAQAHAFAATGAGAEKQTKQYQHHMMWAFRGLEPWSDPA
ncbi:hypothetical protein ACFPFX_23125 [Streptomyces mauvecolor]|uniref:Uncharacterized protein n=2 Tax=Streptomyces TaxID=1883 RepID=A0ABQ3R0L4_9ACTN|nr:hypothetical protein [Streptomyces violascens]GGU08228.1 hypothetical protein GCM10010289_31760 [Streptomyces violascens]GHI43074.1 hypothetical protein Sviol_74820 [Streptomyces violascens]